MLATHGPPEISIIVIISVALANMRFFNCEIHLKEFAKPFQNMSLVPLKVAKSSLQIFFSIKIRVVAACDILSFVVSILYLCLRRVSLPRLDSKIGCRWLLLLDQLAGLRASLLQRARVVPVASCSDSWVYINHPSPRAKVVYGP